MGIRQVTWSLALLVGCGINRELDVDIDPSFAAITSNQISTTAPVAAIDVLVFQGTDDKLIPIRVEFVPPGVRAELSSPTTDHQAQMLVYCSDPAPQEYTWKVIAENSDGFAASDDFTLLVTAN